MNEPPADQRAPFLNYRCASQPADVESWWMSAWFGAICCGTVLAGVGLIAVKGLQYLLSPAW